MAISSYSAPTRRRRPLPHASNDKNPRIWDAAPGPAMMLAGHPASFIRPPTPADGTRIVTLGRQNRPIWMPARGSCARGALRACDAVVSAPFRPRTRIVSGSMTRPPDLECAQKRECLAHRALRHRDASFPPPIRPTAPDRFTASIDRQPGFGMRDGSSARVLRPPISSFRRLLPTAPGSVDRVV